MLDGSNRAVLSPGLEATKKYPLSQPLLEGYAKITGDRNPAGIIHSSHRAARTLVIVRPNETS